MIREIFNFHSRWPVRATSTQKHSSHQALEDRNPVMPMDSRVRYSLKSEIDVQTEMDMAVVVLSKSVNRHGLAELEEHHV